MKKTIYYLMVICLLQSLSIRAQTDEPNEKNPRRKPNTETVAPKPDTSKTDKGKSEACSDTFGTSILEFNVDGQLVSNPPEQIIPGDSVSVRVNLDKSFWDKRMNEAIKRYLSTLENLNVYAKKNSVINYGIDKEELSKLRKELAVRIVNYVDSSSLSKDFKDYYKNKVNGLMFPEIESTEPLGSSYFPPLKHFVNALFTIKYEFYNENGNRINEDGGLFCYPDSEPDPLAPCCEAVGKSAGFYLSKPKTIPKNTYEIKYHLRLKNSLDEEILKKSRIPFPAEFRSLLASIKTTVESDVSDLKKKLEKLKVDSTENSLKDAEDALVKVKKDIEPLIDSLNKKDTTRGSDSRTEWIMKWMWFTEGTPEINPFDATREKLFSAGPLSTPSKVSAEDKAKYQLFEMLLNKGAFQIENLAQLEVRFDTLPKIKARLDKEAEAAKVKEGPFSDSYLYQGLLESSTADRSIFMRHHDAKNDYVVMGINPKSEINEFQRMFVLVDNKAPETKLGINITTESIALDLPDFVNQLSHSAADETHIENKKATSKGFRKRAMALRDGVEALNSNPKLGALMVLSKPPFLPVIVPTDPTPNFQTDLLEHNYFFDAPVMIKYSIKSIAADNTEKEIKPNNNYRINKCYRFRFKAGLVYSLLKVNDYTEVAPNQFTLSNPTFGIDGTFGIQVYFPKQDIRRKNFWAPYAYAGLSMRKIAENFYFGVGIEPMSGLAIGAVAHVGKREELVGQNGIPSSIKQTWGTNVGFTVLVDWVLFTKLFGFTGKTMLGF